MLNKLSLILSVTVHEVFSCMSLRAKRSNLIVPYMQRLPTTSTIYSRSCALRGNE